MTNDKPMTVASRSVTLRDFLIFQIKLFLDGMKDFLAIWVSTGAMILDFIAGRGNRPRLFYSVVRASERFDRWINLHSVLEQMDEAGSEDGMFGVSRAGDDSFVGQLEKFVRGAEEPLGLRGSGSSRESDDPSGGRGERRTGGGGIDPEGP